MTLPPGGRLQPDGSITFPSRGKPPDCNLPDYEVDPNDPYRWILKYCPCQHRRLLHSFICSSGKVRVGDFCILRKLPIQPRYCNVDCDEPNKQPS